MQHLAEGVLWANSLAWISKGRWTLIPLQNAIYVPECLWESRALNPKEFQ